MTRKSSDGGGATGTAATRRTTNKVNSKAKKSAHPSERKKLKFKTTLIVLTEAGYRCAVPTCRQILALDLHHIYQVADGGGDDPSNLIALCGSCHDLYHRGTISADAIYAYKAMLVAISRAFDLEAVDRLLFLSPLKKTSSLSLVMAFFTLTG